MGPLTGQANTRHRLIGALLAVAALVLAACGTRLPDSSFTGAAAGAGGGATSGGGSGSALGTGVQSGASTGAAGTTGGGTGSTGAGGSSGSGGTGSGTGGGTGSGGSGTGGGTGSGTAANGNFASDTGVTASSITIGNVTSVSGAFGPDAFGPTLHGLTAYIDALNDRGGINGRKVNLVTCDDGSEGTQFLACVQRLVEQDHVFAFIGNNSDASASGANFEYTHGVPDVGFPLNNGYYKYPTMFSLYGSPGYPRNGKTVANNGTIETAVGIYQWFKSNTKITKAAVFYYVIPVSAQAGCFDENGLKAVGVPTVYEGGGGSGNCTGAGENPAAPAFDEDVINMRSKGVDNVWDAMDVSGNERLCQAMDRQGFNVKVKASTVNTYSQTIGATWSAPCRDSVYVSASSDSYANTANPLVVRFRQEFAKYQPNATLHQWALEGWMLGYELEDGLKTLGADVTRKGYMAWLDKFPAFPSGYTAGGLMTPITYSAPINFSQSAPSCNTIAQWQDSAGTFVPRAGTNVCPVVPWVPTPAAADGS